MKNKQTLKFILIPALLLCIPAVAMLFTDEVNWKLNDFILMGLLLYSASFICSLILKVRISSFQKILLFSLVIAVLILIWAELAVGLFNTNVAGS
ncbi:MAG: hypothetical protein JNM67_06515 [Bacteroidetes bacterium]|nr:hypothetical protein [Bacteroidota bacterium]